MKSLIAISSLVLLSACSLSGGVNYNPCEDPKIMGQWKAAGKCGDDSLIKYRKDPVNVTGNFVQIHD